MGIQKNSKFSFGNDPRSFSFLSEDYETIEEFVNSLDLPYEGEFDGDTFRLDLMNSDAFSQVFNIISLNKELSSDDDSVADDSEARFTFYGDNFEIKLEGDFSEDIYKLTVERR